MTATARKAYGHSIALLSAIHEEFELRWFWDQKLRGSRLRYPRMMRKITDKAGAVRFAKKWSCPMPSLKEAAS